MTRLKLRNGFKIKFLKLILVVIIIIISFVITFKVLYDKIEIKVDNNTYIDFLVKDTFSNYNLNDIKRLSSTEFLLKYSFGIEKVNTGTNVDIVTPVIKDEKEKSLREVLNLGLADLHKEIEGLVNGEEKE